MKSNQFYCSKKARAASDNIIGTASVHTGFLLIEYKNSFQEKALVESQIPIDVKQIIKSFQQENSRIRILLIRNDSLSIEGIHLFGLSYNSAGKIFNRKIIQSYKDITNELLNSLFIKNNKVIPNENLYLVCTNGKKDKCCAKFGLPIHKQFSNLRTENTWQSTHLGGDRYSPTALVMPSCYNYGHIDIEDVKKIIDKEENGKIYISKVRGNSFLNFFEQAADCLIRKKYSIFGHKEIEVAYSKKLEHDLYNVVLKINSESLKHNVKLKILREKSDYYNYLTCNSDTKSFSSNYSILTEEKV